MTTPSPPLTRKDLYLLLALFCAAEMIRLYFLRFYDVISADGISYIAIAKEFISGRGLSSATHYPPFYPILVGLASVFAKDFEVAGLAVSVAMGSLVVVPAYLLGAEFFNRRIACIAALLTLTWPTLRYWSTAVMSQSTYITLVLFGIYFLWRGCRSSSALMAVLAGICFGCAHLTRSEGVIVLGAVSAALVLGTLLDRSPAGNLRYLLVTWGVFLAVCSPYLYLLHELTGKWQLTGKSKVTIADALSEYLRRPDLKHDPTFREVGYLDLLRHYPDYIRTNWLKNLKTCWQEMLPAYGWVLAGIGLWRGLSRERLGASAYLFATLAPLAVIIVFFFVGPEYTQPYLPVIFLWVGEGLCAVAEGLLPGGEGYEPSRWGASLLCAPVALAGIYGMYNVVREVPKDRDQPYTFRRDGARYDDKRIGLRLRKMLPPDAVLMTRSGRIGFYSERRYEMPPQTDFAGIVRYAKESKIGYLVATYQLLVVRPQLKPLYAPILQPQENFVPPPELELVYAGEEPGGLPYLVYRFR